MSEPIRGRAELVRRLRAADDPRRLLARLQLDVVAEAKRNTVPFRKTGNLGRSIAPGAFIGSRSCLVVARAAYAGWVERGTGIYGPRHRPITPVGARVLVFPAAGAATLGGRVRTSLAGQPGSLVFARSVRGRPATPFLLPGARAALRKNGMRETLVSLWNGAA